MSESVRNRSAAIRAYLMNTDSPGDPVTVRRYSAIAARWESLRLLIDSDRATPADDTRFRELSGLLRAATEQLGLETCTETDKGLEGIPGLTRPNGFLPADPERILAKDWRDAARDW